MKLPLARRITSDGVAPEQQGVVDTIGNIVNSFMEDVTDIINGNVDYFDNIVSNIVQVEVMVNSLGIPVSETVVNPNMIRQPLGSICINVRNQNGSGSIDLNGQPFAIISPQGNDLIKIDKVLNLKQNQKYILTLLFF